MTGVYMQKKIAVLNIGTSFLIIAVLAMIAFDIVSTRLAKVFPRSEKRGSIPVTSAESENLLAYSPILEKGLFGKASIGKLSPLIQTSARNPAASPSDLTLLGTAVGSFRETYALIQRTSTHEEQVFRLGEKVFDLGSLVAVRKESAEILSGGRRIKILTPTAAPEDTGKIPAQAPPVSGGLNPQMVAPGSYIIDQRALNAALDNIGQAMTDARLLPSSKDGKVQGFNVSEVKPAGIFGMVGIKNGDTLLRINDFSIDSPEKAIQSLASLKGQNRIKLDLIRDGQPTTFNYEIR
jgi:general secretion pathway protein C